MLKEELLSYIPYNVMWQYKSYDKKLVDKYFTDYLTVSTNGTVLTTIDKTNLTKDSSNMNFYLNDYLKEKFKIYRKGRLMLIDNCYDPIYRIGLGRLKYSKRFKNSDLGEKVKPILRPISDLNKPLEENGLIIIPKLYFKEFCYGNVFEYEGELHIEKITTNIHLIYQQLMRWHFDIYGLIKKGNAVDINNI